MESGGKAAGEVGPAAKSLPTGEILGRAWIGIDVKPQYAEMAKVRIQRERDKRAQHENKTAAR